VRIVLDTNVLVSGIFWSGTPSKILDLWVHDKFQLLTTQLILEEYNNTLNRISKGKKDSLVNAWMLFVVENSIVVNDKKKFKLSADPDDDKFIDCAVSGNADFIVSGDSHLLDLISVLNVNIIKPNSFIDLLK
jgi:putative PIN family toxin of toxin-antitoxin system